MTMMETLNFYLEELFSNRESTRQKALSKLNKLFMCTMVLQFARENYFTLLSRCENSILMGSAAEIALASKTIGLLALTLGSGYEASDLFENALPMLFLSLKSESQCKMIPECLAIVTFVGAPSFVGTEEAMQILWRYICPEPIADNRDLIMHRSAPVVAGAISAWSFLLTTINVVNIRHKQWQGVIAHFLKLLEEGDEAVRVNALEALALTLSKGSLTKFSKEANECICIQEVEDQIIEHIKRFCDPTWKLTKLFEKNSHETSNNICGRLSVLVQLKKIKFLKQFLGDGFKRHVKSNDFLRNLLPIMDDRSLKEDLYEPEIDEVTVFFVPTEIKKNNDKLAKRVPRNGLHKAKAQLRNKHRQRAQERKMEFMMD